MGPLRCRLGRRRWRRRSGRGERGSGGVEFLVAVTAILFLFRPWCSTASGCTLRGSRKRPPARARSPPPASTAPRSQAAAPPRSTSTTTARPGRHRVDGRRTPSGRHGPSDRDGPHRLHRPLAGRPDHLHGHGPTREVPSSDPPRPGPPTSRGVSSRPSWPSARRAWLGRHRDPDHGHGLGRPGPDRGRRRPLRRRRSTGQRRQRRTLWGALTSQTAVFRIAAGRHASEAQTMLGERYRGIVCSDRYGGYDYLDPTRRQLCWAHLLRDFTAHSEGMGEQAQFGAAGLAVATDLFNAWQQFQHDDNHARLRRRIKPLQAKLRAELEHASRKSARTRYHRQFARNLLKRWPALLDLHPHPRRRADQQPRRTRPPRRGHPPQALARQSIRTRRAHDRTTPLRLNHLPTPQTVALRLPHPGHHRPRPRRPNTQPQLTLQRLNAYG